MNRKPGETFTDYILRFLADADRELYRRIDQCREADANTYVIEG